MADLGAQTDFEMHSGDTREINFSIVDENGGALELAGASLAWLLSKRNLLSEASIPQPKGTASVSKSIGSGIVVTDETNGKATVTLVPADTDKLKGDFYHELQVTDATGKVSTAAFGAVTIFADLIE